MAKYLKERWIKYHFEETQTELKIYNQCILDGETVGGSFHSTC